MAAKKPIGHQANRGADAQEVKVIQHRQLNIVMLGKTGTGKSSLGNAMLKASDDRKFTLFSLSGGLCAAPIRNAKKATERTFLMKGHRIRLVDTAGVYDNNKEENGGGDKNALSSICSSVSRCTDGVDAFFIVIRLDSRFTEEESKAIDKLENLFGEDFWRYVVLIFTHADAEDLKNDPKKCNAVLKQAKTDLPSFERLVSKVQTTGIPVDASQNVDPKVAEKQATSMLKVVDGLVVMNKTRFKPEPLDPTMAMENAEMKRELEELRGHLLNQQNKSTLDEEAIQNLKKQNADLEHQLSKKMKDEDIIKYLSDKIIALEDKLAKMMEEDAKRHKCPIL